MAKPQAPLRHLYPRVTAFSNLLAAFRKASRGKRYRTEVLAFGAKLEGELFRLQRELESFTDAPGAFRLFLVHEPKRRLVSAAPFRDRVVRHALIAVIAPPLGAGFSLGAGSSPPTPPTARAMAPTAPCAASAAPACGTAGSSRRTSARISRASITVCSWLSWRG